MQHANRADRPIKIRSVSLPEKTDARLLELSKRKGRSRSAVVAELINKEPLPKKGKK